MSVYLSSVNMSQPGPSTCSKTLEQEGLSIQNMQTLKLRKRQNDVYTFADINCRLVNKTASKDCIYFNSENELNEILKKL